jgi:hypothetical protein
LPTFRAFGGLSVFVGGQWKKTERNFDGWIPDFGFERVYPRSLNESRPHDLRRFDIERKIS